MKNLEVIFELLSYEGSATNNPADAIRVKNRIQETEIASVSRQQIQVPNSTTDLAITLPDDSSDYLIILVDRTLSMKLNNISTPIELSPRGNGTKTFAFFCRGPITSLSLSNSSGASANVDIILANK